MSLRGRSVLLIGPGSAALAQALLPLGLELSCVATAAEGAGAAAAHELVVSLFPEGVAEVHAAAAQVPVVSVGAPAGESARLLREGALDVLPAPLDVALLRLKISAVLRFARAAQQAGSEAALGRAESARRDAEAAQARAESAQQDAEAAARLKDQFLATLSHEMRTPLTSILGWVRMLRLGKTSAEPSGRALGSIERNAQLQAALIDDLLDLQRMTAGKMSLTFRDVEVGALLEAVVHALQPAADEAAIHLRLLRPVDEELYVLGDGARLHQVFASLLSNAIKFSRADGQVQVQLHPAGSEVTIAVNDDGRGIEPSFLPHAFEPFRQEDSQLSRREGGLGVGLSIVRHLVDQHGGQVSAESNGEGSGARFTVSLPLRARVARPRAPAPRSAEPQPPARCDLQGVRVLVVEDDLDAQYLLVTILEQFGARVSSRSSAAEALSALKASPFDLMLSDISMPGEDGYSFIRRVREGNVQRDIPAAALTANARSEDRARALASGFQAHIAKPVDPLELAEKLASVLQRQ